MDYFQEFIHKSRYARWIDSEGRREDWGETVQRLISYYNKKVDDWTENGLTPEEDSDLFQSIYNLEVMPSMRCMMTAGPALDRCNVGAYNCAYLPVDSPRSFDEAMYILMCGTGIGFSVEDKYVTQLPRISEHFEQTDTTLVVGDSKEGWAKSLRELVSLLIAGQIPQWNVSRVRGAGERLVTFGGRASGPEPLVRLFEFCVALFVKAKGRRLTALECHDLMCMIGDVVVVGGVRRSAMISLSDLGNEQLAHAKSGQWWEANVYRQLSNNSAVYDRKPDVGEYLKEFKAIYDSKSGERGIFNREAARTVVGRTGRRNPDFEWGTNPCSEIILRPFQFCNLTSVVVQSDDSLEELARKVRLATILGTIQSGFTDFRYLRKVWQRNCEEERLLGVSLTGIANRDWTPEELKSLRQVSINTNIEWSNRLGINPSTAITCVKPEGTTSQLVNSSSGIHDWWAAFFNRTVRNDSKDPLSRFLQDSGVPCEIDQRNPAALVFSFPRKAPVGAKTRYDHTALEMLETWKMFQEHWCEHKPSVTIYIKEEEWLDVAAWCYKNFDILSGIAFLPHDPRSYPQAPYQDLTEEGYDELVKTSPVSLDWEKLKDYEQEDNTTGSQELACIGGSCEI